MHNVCKKIQDGRHLVQNKVSLEDILKMNLLLYFQANCNPNFPEKKQIYNFLDMFFQRLLKVKKIEKKFFGGWGVGVT